MQKAENFNFGFLTTFSQNQTEMTVQKHTFEKP